LVQEKPRDEAAAEEEEEKRAVLAAGVREGDDRVRPAAAAAGSGNRCVPRPSSVKVSLERSRGWGS
jgi:hypothetical protein